MIRREHEKISIDRVRFLLESYFSVVINENCFSFLEIKEKKPNRETFLYGSLDPDLSLIFNKFKDRVQINYIQNNYINLIFEFTKITLSSLAKNFTF